MYNLGSGLLGGLKVDGAPAIDSVVSSPPAPAQQIYHTCLMSPGDARPLCRTLRTIAAKLLRNAGWIFAEVFG